MVSPENRLAREKSPYLLQHARNPVDWFPWGAEAFARARTEDKPIFLSIGYSTCHWCHVMEHESFESAAIAAFLAENFISIKVDREERPDVDQVYMAFVQATTGHGGWPMSVWLTPDLRPFFGGTYFPPTDVPGRAGFITVLRRIAELWKTDRGQIEDKAHSLLAALRESGEEAAREVDKEWTPAASVRAAIDQFARMFDARHGGFGGAPKFPRPAGLSFLFALGARGGERGEPARGMGLHTLRQMAAGGIRDHLGGGFHRYSVDDEWHVPHFEKMLYDQAQLAHVFLTGYQVSGEEPLAEVARSILNYVREDLTDAEGGFYSAEDADSFPRAGAARKTEGAFYIWKEEEIRALLGVERTREFGAIYGILPEANVPPGADPHGELDGENVLIQRRDPQLEAKEKGENGPAFLRRLAEARGKLLAAREQRPRPHLDDKILTAWNGLMIGAFARAAQVLDDEIFLRAAQRAARFIRERLFDPASGELKRSFRAGPSNVPGFASDYAFLISGLLDLYAADFDLEWLRWARRLQDTLDLHFWDQLRGGYFSVSDRDPEILLRMKEDYDGAEPTPTSVALGNLWRFGQIYHNDVLLEHARHAVRAFSGRLESQPFGMPLLLAGAMLMETPPVHLILHAADQNDSRLKALLAEARRVYLPQLIVICITSAEAQKYFAPRHPVIEQLPKDPQHPAAYLCENYVCHLPVTSPAELRTLIARVAGAVRS